MRKTFFALLAMLGLIGCASEILKSYVGKDLSVVMLDYGPPQNKFKMPDGTIAFQWIRSTGVAMPTTSNVTGYGNTATVTTYGGGYSSWECAYTLFGKPNNQNSYTIVGYQQPKIDCE